MENIKKLTHPQYCISKSSICYFMYPLLIHVYPSVRACVPACAILWMLQPRVSSKIAMCRGHLTGERQSQEEDACNVPGYPCFDVPGLTRARCPDRVSDSRVAGRVEEAQWSCG